MVEKKTKREIIDEMARDKKVEEFISNTAKTSNIDLTDLAQDIYLSLLQYDDEKIEGMYERGELDFFLARMITNNINSQTSPFYSHYRKWTTKRSEITNDLKNNYEESDENRWMQKKSVPPCSGN